MRPKKISQLGQTPTAGSILTGLLSTANNSIIVRTQITPDIVIDLNKLLTPGTSGSDAVSGQNSTVLDFIKPSVIVNAVGFQKKVEPYGAPSENFGLVLAALALGLVALGGASAFWVCKRVGRKPSSRRR